MSVVSVVSKFLLALMTGAVASIPSTVSAEEYLIFKRLTDRLGIVHLPYEYTVWHVDALDMAKQQIAGNAKSDSAPEEAMLKAQERLHRFGAQRLHALFLMTYAAREKMHKYGLTKTPSAVLLDDEGEVIKRWETLESGSDLYLLEGK